MLLSEQLKRNYNLKDYWLNVSLEDVSAFNESLANALVNRPYEYINQVSILQTHVNFFVSIICFSLK